MHKVSCDKDSEYFQKHLYFIVLIIVLNRMEILLFAETLFWQKTVPLNLMYRFNKHRTAGWKRPHSIANHSDTAMYG
jgi:hypothetical protein